MEGEGSGSESESESEKVFDSLNLNPQLFINEAFNLVDDLTEGAFDTFYQEAATILKTEEGTDRSEELKQGVAWIQYIIKSTLDKKLSTWERYCLRNVFTVPEGFSLPKDDGPSSDASLKLDGLRDPERDAKLDSLRERLSQVEKESAELKKEIQTLERQSTLSSQSAASLTEALELQQSVNEKYEELVQYASEFRTKVENITTRSAENAECQRVKKIRTSNGHMFGLNSSDGLFSATLEELHEILDVMKAS